MNILKYIKKIIGKGFNSFKEFEDLIDLEEFEDEPLFELTKPIDETRDYENNYISVKVLNKMVEVGILDSEMVFVEGKGDYSIDWVLPKDIAEEYLKGTYSDLLDDGRNLEKEQMTTSDNLSILLKYKEDTMIKTSEMWKEDDELRNLISELNGRTKK